MRVLALALALFLLAAAPAGATKIAYRDGKRVLVVFVGNTLRRPVVPPNDGPLHWSGDGRLLSIGGTVLGWATLPAADLSWAPTGERAAYVTKRGGVVVWSPGARTVVVPDGWGAQRLAWGAHGALALGRAVCRGACGIGTHKEIWVWRAGSLTRVVGPLYGDLIPMPFGWSRGKVLWWTWPDSGSVASDGVAINAGSTTIAKALMYTDYVAACGDHLAIAAGGDRYAMDNKKILWDGRDVSHDLTHSWVSPSCTANGRLVAAASRNLVPSLIGREHRAIWQLLPSRRRLTQPPWGWTDEYPQALPDGSTLFIRTRVTTRKSGSTWIDTDRGKIELLRNGRITELGLSTIVRTELDPWEPLNFYGHYSWAGRIAVAA